MSKHHEEHPDYGALGIFAGYGECDDPVPGEMSDLEIEQLKAQAKRHRAEQRSKEQK